MGLLINQPFLRHRAQSPTDFLSQDICAPATLAFLILDRPSFKIAPGKKISIIEFRYT